MKFPQRTLDRVALENATYRSKRYYEDVLQKADAASTDAMRRERLDACQCKTCFYLTGRFGGAACSERPCANCGTPVTHGSTDVDVLCHDCAKELGLCCHCGSDVELKMRRKWPTVGAQS